ncbi:MAG: hypothetical protein ACTSRW_00325 [Candidatus Helarchaeota archaeon]
MKTNRMKKSIILTCLIVCSMFMGIIPLLIGISPVAATTSAEIQVSETYNWTIILYETVAQDNAANWTDAYDWLAPPKGTYSANISNDLNPDLNFTVTAKDDSFINGTIRIGNSSYAGVDQYEIGTNLMLGYFSAQFGLISTIDWEQNKNLFWAQKAVSEGYGNSFNAYWVIDNGSWIIFHVEQLPDSVYGFWQNTTLIYNKSNGILLHANTQNSGYHLIIGTFPSFYLNWTLTKFESVGADNYIEWYDNSWSPVANFSANLTGTLNPDVNYTFGQINNGKLIGNLSIGNETFHDVGQEEIGSNLMLGYYPTQFGLIASTDWNSNKDAFINGIESAASYGTEFEYYGIYDNTTHVVFYVFQNDSYFDTWQNTTLVYHKQSGVLLHADTSFGNSTHVSVHLIFDVFPSIFFDWTLTGYYTNATDNAATWVDGGSFVERANYTANKSGWFSSSLNFSLSGIKHNLTTGMVKIGNETYTNANQKEIGINLNLGYMNAQFGLMTWNDWTKNKQVFMDQKTIAEGYGYQFQEYYWRENVTHIKFRVDQLNNSASGQLFQNTTLIYEKKTGLLVYADTSTGTGNITTYHVIIGTFTDIPEESTPDEPPERPILPPPIPGFEISIVLALIGLIALGWLLMKRRSILKTKRIP